MANKKETRCPECDSILESKNKQKKTCPTPELHSDYLVKLSSDFYNTTDIVHRTPMLLFTDFETAPWLAYGHNSRHDPRIIGFKKYGYMISAGFKWAHEDKPFYKGLPDFDLYKENPYNDRALVEYVVEQFNKADAVIAHNLNGFDDKVLNARVDVHDIVPPEEYKRIDTLSAAKKAYGSGRAIPSLSLDTLCDFFELDRKYRKSTGLWERCVDHDEYTEKERAEAWKEMKIYNLQDVVILEQLFYKIRHRVTGLAMNILNGDFGSCPYCGDNSPMEKLKSKKVNKVSTAPTYRCIKCRAQVYGRTLDPVSVLYKS